MPSARPAVAVSVTSLVVRRSNCTPSAVAVRQWIAGITLLAAGRPRFRSFTWAQWWPVLLLAVAYGTMNLSLYSAIDRLGLGLAVTLEFLGPLTVAIAPHVAAWIWRARWWPAPAWSH
jgi:threonine/homoserine efflux transporter RhtA